MGGWLRWMFALILPVVMIIAMNPLYAGGRFPTGKFIVEPERHQLGMGVKKVQGTADFQKLSDFPRNDDNYQLGTRVGHLTMGRGMCSGSLVGPDLFLTNHHCSVDGDERSFAPDVYRVYMEYWRDGKRGPVSSRVSQVLKSNEELDYALLKLDQPIGRKYGWLELERDTAARRAKAVKIIQHPQGRSKEIVLKNTSMVRVMPSVAHYMADTEGGSSGSPVFNLYGDKIIALHHVGTNRYNEGVMIDRIYTEIRSYLPKRSSSGGGSRSGSQPTPRPSQPVSGDLGGMLGQDGW
jgi:V8-like Glu-specific endopeptidase